MSQNHGEHSNEHGEQPALPPQNPGQAHNPDMTGAPEEAMRHEPGVNQPEAATAANPQIPAPHIPVQPAQAPQSAAAKPEDAAPMNHTEPIPAPYNGTPAAYPGNGQSTSQYPAQQDHPTSQYPAQQEHPTSQYPAQQGQGTQHAQGSQQGQHAQHGHGSQHGHDSRYGQGAAHEATGQAGPGYPASNAYPQSYPQTLAPAVTARPRERKKVGMGMFTGGVLAAALIGGLVGGGSLYLLDQQNNSTATGSSSQSAPIVVNNPNSVNAVTAAAAKAMPSVVTISATSGNSGGTGSGIILDTEGHILTNTHVVTLDGAAAHATIEVQTSDNKVYPATIVGTDPLSDLAVVKIDAPNLVPATLGDSGKINVGDTVIAIGSPLGLNGTVTDGIISTLNRTIQVASSAVPETPSDGSQTPNDGGNGFQFSPPGGGQNDTAAQGTVNLNVIQTDAAINPGNSGGALVDSNGHVIGVNVAIASTGSSSDSSSQSGNIGVGFSIPISHAKQVAEQIIANGKATHGQLGVSVSGTASSTSDSAFSVGATVKSVTEGSAAAKVGLKEGDVITKLGDRTISDPADLTAAVREQPGGATVKIDFTRDGKAQSMDITLDTMPAE